MGTPDIKKMVLSLDLHDDKAKKKAMKAVSSLLGIDSIAMDMKEKKMTVIGVVDPVVVVTKLRKSCGHTEIISIGPAKEQPGPAKIKEQKKEEPKNKEEPAKSKGESKKEEEPKKKEAAKESKTDPAAGEQVAELVKMYRAYNPYMTTHYVVHSAEEDPNLCCIC